MDIDEFTQKAKLHYEKHLKRVSDYQKDHPDKCSAMLEKKRAYYQNVRKPKLDALKSKSEPK
jgi:hypothetical protein